MLCLQGQVELLQKVVIMWQQAIAGVRKHLHCIPYLAVPGFPHQLLLIKRFPGHCAAVISCRACQRCFWGAGSCLLRIYLFCNLQQVKRGEIYIAVGTDYLQSRVG